MSTFRWTTRLGAAVLALLSAATLSIHAANDDPDARVLRAEHVLYPPVVHAVAAGDLTLGADGELAAPFLKSPLPLFDAAADDATLRAVLDKARR